MKVIDCGKDVKTIEWMQTQIDSGVTYLRQPDKNLYNAMNKGIYMSRRSKAIFVNVVDETSKVNQIKAALEDLENDEGFIGCLRRKEGRERFSEVGIKTTSIVICLIKQGIKATSHQATIYTLNFLRERSYDVNVGLIADQLPVKDLLENRKVGVEFSEVLCSHICGGLGDTQPRGAFLKQMPNYNCADASRFKLVSELVLVFPFLIIKLILKKKS